ncbi:LutB/LldF family L-lactate oxidation iron-sulfur protein [Microbacter margulisiae]|uniref:L-lactate dehydrogenase complex protein LldF n=1 Tax=Microbacter margulisiae TaxID=1350067 RepID=A0A7W5DP89_9PORP|nr:LutB/LldF family L-lactate oxidation iron-sulfur protein [Microbacter margulisiae]MBB3186406.1 L-lactate dehydrogenase complex protein LldF [Microbacter margulisiae]
MKTTLKATTQFHKDAAKIAFNERHRKTLQFNISRYDLAVERGYKRYENLSLAKDRAAYIKRFMLAHWDEYLLQFETNITQRGAKVLWAMNAQEVVLYVNQILTEHQAKLLVKSKSMTTEEVSLNEVVQKLGCESVETDLGEFIVQVAGERPYHIVTPAMHKSKEDIAALFHDKFETPIDSSPEELTAYVRALLRKKFIAADVGVTGANFLIADIGAVAVTENEGNALMSTSFPKLHIVIAGIEKIIPEMRQLGLFQPLLATLGTGQQVTAYNTIFAGPRQQGEIDGPEEMVVILLDNGRTAVYEDDEVAEVLSCIRCGACLNACPVYKTIGGYTYNATYSGPIGSVITPFFKGMKEMGHLSFACSLCEKCAEVCPVRIPLPKLLLVNRRKVVEGTTRPLVEKISMKAFGLITGKRFWFDLLPANIKNIGAAPLNFTLWGPRRKMPVFHRSFTKQWNDR